MGRELKRVPLDFDWPIGKEWTFQNPYEPDECNECGGSNIGYKGRKLAKKLKKCLSDSEFWEIAKQEGCFDECDECDDGRIYITPKSKELYWNWEQPKIPTGEGYQMWSTTSDCPMSPVFKSKEELVDWLVKTRAVVHGFTIGNRTNWEAIVEAGGIPTMVVDSDGIKIGAECLK